MLRTEDYNHPFWKVKTPYGLAKAWIALDEEYEPDEENQAFRILSSCQRYKLISCLTKGGEYGYIVNVERMRYDISFDIILEGERAVTVFYPSSVMYISISLGECET
jgi:hypothetical protein